MKTTKTVYSFDELMSLLRVKLPNQILDCITEIKHKMFVRGVILREEVESTILKEHLLATPSFGSVSELPSPVSYSLRQVDIEREIIVDLQPCGVTNVENQIRLTFRWVGITTNTIVSSTFNSDMLENDTILNMLADFFKNKKRSDEQIAFIEQFNLLIIALKKIWVRFFISTHFSIALLTIRIY